MKKTRLFMIAFLVGGFAFHFLFFQGFLDLHGKIILGALDLLKILLFFLITTMIVLLLQSVTTKKASFYHSIVDTLTTNEARRAAWKNNIKYLLNYSIYVFLIASASIIITCTSEVFKIKIDLDNGKLMEKQNELQAEMNEVTKKYAELEIAMNSERLKSIEIIGMIMNQSSNHNKEFSKELLKMMKYISGIDERRLISDSLFAEIAKKNQDTLLLNYKKQNEVQNEIDGKIEKTLALLGATKIDEIKITEHSNKNITNSLLKPNLDANFSIPNQLTKKKRKKIIALTKSMSPREVYISLDKNLTVSPERGALLIKLSGKKYNKQGKKKLFRNADFSHSYIDESGLDLSNFNLRYVDLSESILKGINFSKSDMRDGNLSKAVFDLARMRETKFQGAKLIATNFVGTNLESADFTGAKLQRANFTNATLTNAKFISVDLTETNLNGANLEGASFAKVDLSSANLEEAIVGTLNWFSVLREEGVEGMDEVERKYLIVEEVFKDNHKFIIKKRNS